MEACRLWSFIPMKGSGATEALAALAPLDPAAPALPRVLQRRLHPGTAPLIPTPPPPRPCCQGARRRCLFLPPPARRPSWQCLCSWGWRKWKTASWCLCWRWGGGVCPGWAAAGCSASWPAGCCLWGWAESVLWVTSCWSLTGELGDWGRGCW